MLAEFARTLGTDFPIQAILDSLVARIVDVLPITAAGVTLISFAATTPRYVAASDELALRFERLQTDLGEGPCLLAYQSGEAVAASDLSTDARFPRFTAAARASGLAAVFTFPLRQSDTPFGALDLYRDTPGELDSEDMEAAQTLADVVAAYLLNAWAREEAVAASEHFRHVALHDPLTGLPNRLLLQQRLEHAAQRARRSHTNAAVLFADLDRFKQVNDTHGHQVGDELLLAVAHRLAGLVRPGDTLARVSGDEFVFLCEDLHSAADVEILAHRIEEALAHPFALAGVELAVTASVGMAFAGPGEEISNQLILQADIAMYQAKRHRRGQHEIIDLRGELMSSEHHPLAGDLRSAIGDGGIDVAYQPIVRSADGLVTGVEALLRWTHPTRGPVPAASVVKVAESTGLINQIGARVLERGCYDRSRWLRNYPGAPLDLAVNVSVRQLMSPDFLATVASVLARTGMDPAGLILEVTESVLIEDNEHVMTVLAKVKDVGVRVALDDFGAGYSSLSYLRRLPLDNVKIDQSFIADVGRTTTGTAIVGAVTHLAHTLGLSVTAEGVETPRQRDEIRAAGCEFAQGHFYAAAMSAAALDAHLGVRPTSRPQLPSPRPAAETETRG